MEGVVFMSRDLKELSRDFNMAQMGCSQSSGSVDINRVPEKESKKQVDMNSNTKEETENNNMKKESSEEAAIGRFQQQLLQQLQSIGPKPPVMPMQPVEGDSRQLLVPSLFRCADTLSELQQTPLPQNSCVVATYLKSGTHWLWEIVKMLKKGEAVADEMPKEMAHLEFFPPSVLKEIHGKELQVYATHFPLWTLPKDSYKNSKLIYVYRNPKDVCVSLFYHFKSMSEANPEGFPMMSFDQCFEMFLGPSEANIMGNWFDNVADYWDNHRNNPDILCVRYEDMKRNPEEELRRIDAHIGTEASPELLKDIIRVTSFTNMKKDKHSSEKHLEIVFKGSMYRKGEIGDWKNHLSEEQNSRLDQVIADWQEKRAEPVSLVYE